MLPYLLKSILCLGIFLAVYLLFLEKEKMHRFNRWYLLGSIVFAFVVPLISFTVTPESLPVLQGNYFLILEEPANALAATVSAPARNASLADYIVPFAIAIYLIVAFFMLARFTRNFYRILSSAFQNKTIAYRGAKLVLMKERTASYSFLQYIFVSEDEYANNLVEAEIITHELTHVQQKHSWDVIFIELLQAVLWFNPLFIFYKKAIQLNHEYLADEAVIRTYADVTAYQYLLLDKAACVGHAHFTSNFNYSVTKKRLIMLTKNHNKVTAFFKKITLIPTLACTIVCFSAKEMMAQEKTPTQKKSGETVAPQLLRDTPHPPGAGASKEEMDAYNAIIDKNIKLSNKGFKVLPHVTPEERSRLLAIYKHMDVAQRDNARVVFYKRRQLSPPKPPTKEQLEKWKDADLYGVWIGSKKIKNEELNNYKPEDFGYNGVSNLRYTEEMKRNVMKTFNLTKMYKCQVNLYTMAESKKMYQHDLEGPAEELLFQMGTRNGNKLMVPVQLSN